MQDRLGGFTRLTCPDCTAQIRFRGLSETEAAMYRGLMSQHLSEHGQRS
ncbi:hypothetical protein [Streptomyces sp. NPDC015125]